MTNEITKEILQKADKFHSMDWNDDVKIDHQRIAGCKGGILVILSMLGKRHQKSIPNDRLYFYGIYFRDENGNDNFTALPISYGDISHMITLLTDNLYFDKTRWNEISTLMRKLLNAMKFDNVQRDDIMEYIKKQKEKNIDKWINNGTK